MKWFKIIIESLLNNKLAKKIINIVFYIIVILFSIFILGLIFDYSREIQTYPYAKNALTVVYNVQIFFIILLALSLLITNKKLLLVVWFIAFFQLYPLFLDLPELKRVQQAEICIDTLYCTEEDGGLNESACLEKGYA